MKRSNRTHLGFVQLESRINPTDIFVRNANDSGSDSLRDAIDTVNSNGTGNDRIVFEQKYFTTPAVIELQSALKAIQYSTEIVGISGKGFITVQGTGGHRVLEFTAKVPEQNSALTISDLTITNGSIADSGGGIFVTWNTSSLTLNNVTVSGNTAGFDGGGIFSQGPVALNTCIISNNVAGADNIETGHGGGIKVNNFPLTLDKTTVSGNSCDGNGGGVYWNGDSQTHDFKLLNSTISGNSSDSDGGGIYIVQNTRTGANIYTFTNSTLSGNSAGGDGGGLMLNGAGNKSTQNFLFLTVTGNVADNGGGIALIDEGAPYTPTYTFFGTALVLNSADPDPDITPSNGVFQISYCAITDSSGIVTIAGTNLIGELASFDVNMDPLNFYGGPTKTHRLQFDSDLIDNGPPPSPPPPLPAVPDRDQRNFKRIVGSDADIGAFEYANIVSSISINGGSAQRSRVLSITVNFGSNVNAADASGAGESRLIRTHVSSANLDLAGTLVESGATGANGIINVSPSTGTVSSITLTFANANSANVTAGVEYLSLSDGRWQLELPEFNFASEYNALDLHRLFGDWDGNGNSDGTVNGDDFSAFGIAFGYTNPHANYSIAFDFDNNGTIDSVDLAQFGNRWGITV